MKEEWKPVLGYEGLYEVSNTGKVRSLSRSVVDHNGNLKSFNGGMLTLHSSKLTKRHPKPIFHVELWKNNKRQVFLIHRLVAQHFIPNPEGKPQINHIDGNRRNNNISNLEWVTCAENTKHAYRTGLHKKHNCKPVKGTNVITGKTFEFESTEAAARGTGGNPDAIRGALKGRLKTSNGFTWEYIN